MKPFQIFSSERLLLSVGRLLSTRPILTITIAALLSIVVSGIIVYLVRGSVTLVTPLIALVCCVLSALPVHAILGGYYNFIVKQQAQVEIQAQRLETLNNKLAEQNQDLTAFSHRVAHDLRNPIMVILSNAFVLKESESMLEVHEIADDIVKAGENAEEIIASILLLSQARAAPPVLRACEIYTSLNNAIEKLDTKLADRRVTVHVTESPELVALAYAPWLERVWVNLIDNALKYAGAVPNIEAGAAVEGERIRCWVSDDGPGIPEVVRSYLFRDFQQQDEHQSSGFGLGLSMISQLLTHMNGEIAIEGAEGEGAKMVFFLQMAATDS